MNEEPVANAGPPFALLNQLSEAPELAVNVTLPVPQRDLSKAVVGPEPIKACAGTLLEVQFSLGTKIYQS